MYNEWQQMHYNSLYPKKTKVKRKYTLVLKTSKLNEVICRGVDYALVQWHKNRLKKQGINEMYLITKTN